MSEPLTPREAEALRRAGLGSTEPNNADSYPTHPAREGAERHNVILANALSLADAAALIGVEEAEILSRISDGTLFSVSDGDELLIPRFLFEKTRELPWLGPVLTSIRRQVSVVALEGFFNTPQLELDGMTPRAWLVADHDPIHVQRIAASL
jgi:hypothetical protein